MKKLIIGILALSSLSAMGNTLTIQKEIELKHRVLNTCEKNECYFDIYTMKREYGYGLALEFGNDHGENLFGAVQVVDELGKIVDLGKMSCSEVRSDSNYNRKTQAWDWLNYSDAWDQLNDVGQANLKAEEGHCYLMYKTSSNLQSVVAFHVKSLIKNQSVVLDEIEVFKRAKISNIKAKIVKKK